MTTLVVMGAATYLLWHATEAYKAWRFRVTRRRAMRLHPAYHQPSHVRVIPK